MNSCQSSVTQAAQVFNQDLNVVLISNTLDHVDTIAQAGKDKAKVIVVDANTDTLQTVEQSLENLVQATGKKIGTLAVVAHGTDGAVEIGADNIQLANFFKYDSGLKALSTVLAESAQIQFYGCSVAGDAAGQTLLGQIAVDTHANVFASTNNTGGVRNYWHLEYSTAPGTPMHVLLDNAKLASLSQTLPSSMAFDSDNLSPMQVVALNTDMDRVDPATSGVQNLAVGRSGSVDLDSVRLTQIFC